MIKPLRLLLSISLCLGILTSSVEASIQEDIPTIRVGLGFEINPYKRNDIPSQFLLTTFETIRDRLKGKYLLDLQEMSKTELADAIARNKIEVFVASASFYRKRLPKGARDLASVVNVQASNPNQTVGGLVLTRAIDGEPRTLLELQGKRIATSQEFEDEALQTIYGEIARYEDLIPEKFFGGITWLEPRFDFLINALQKEQVDAVLVPACTFENYSWRNSADTSWIHAVDQRHDKSLRCLHSTELYPGLTFVSLPGLPPAAARILTDALLNVPSVNQMHWGVATDFSGVDRMLFRLDRNSWGGWRHWSYDKILKTYWPWVAGLIGFIAILLSLILLVGMLVRRRTAQLNRALQTQMRMNREAEIANRRIEKLQKIGTIGQMAGVVAHELSQPLAAIAGFAHGIGNFNKNSPNRDQIAFGVKCIEEETHRIGEILNRVRDYVKSRSNRDTLIDFSELVAHAIENFGKTGDGDIEVRFSKIAELWVKGDPLELELVVINLLRNASQAQKDQVDAWIHLELLTTADKIQLIVTDNGPEIPVQIFESIRTTGDSTKPEGLGLGLSIVHSLIQAHSGSMELFLTASGNLSVTITLPKEYEDTFHDRSQP